MYVSSSTSAKMYLTSLTYIRMCLTSSTSAQMYITSSTSAKNVPRKSTRMLFTIEKKKLSIRANENNLEDYSHMAVFNSRII